MIRSGWLTSAFKKASPNFNERPEGEVSLIVIHCMSLPEGQYGTGNPEKLFLNELDATQFPKESALTVSAHLLISREGAVTQFVSFDDRAWHAGESHFNGRENCNDFAIGIELEGTDHTPFTDEQYTILRQVVDGLKEAYPLVKTNIVGHSDIAPGRKTDPGQCFDWERIK